jgi:hypothetical protein
MRISSLIYAVNYVERIQKSPIFTMKKKFPTIRNTAVSSEVYLPFEGLAIHSSKGLFFPPNIA